jgi:hypothetical protein
MKPIAKYVRDAHYEGGAFIPEQQMKIYYHDDIASPRSPGEFSNMAHMVCFHRRMMLGDADHGINPDSFTSWSELEQYLINERGAYLICPLSIYDHSGVTIFIGCPSDPWDSGQVGFVYVTKDDILHEYGEVTPETERLARRVIEGEVETYDRYLRGEVYGYEIFENGKFYDSCWGFYCEPKEIPAEIWNEGTYREVNC